MRKRILFVTSEIYPYIKTGGLGDVAGSLPLALKKQGLDIRLCLPGYKPVLKNFRDFIVLKKFSNFFKASEARLLLGTLSNGMTSYILDCPAFFDRDGVYVDKSGKDWEDNHLRFAALSRIAADIYLHDSSWQPDIIHGNDWQTGLIPAYLSHRGCRPLTTLTIHNLAYQGLFPAHVFPDLDLPAEAFSSDGLEFHGQIGYLKAGLYYADKITTVSPTYAQEIQTEEFGCGLDGLLRQRSQDLTGILNGIDQDVWNPMTDQYLNRNYNARRITHKANNKKAILRTLGLPWSDKPLFAVIGRLTHQKGFDLILQAAPKILQQEAYIIFLGQGDPDIEAKLRSLEQAYPQQVRAHIGYEEAFEHQLQGAADAVIMPSRFEPCGLVQMYGLRYGAVPIVRNTGGLADTVMDTGKNNFNKKATGFVFDDATPCSLANTIDRAMSTFAKRGAWEKIQRNAMAQDFSWGKAASQYNAVYAQAA